MTNETITESLQSNAVFQAWAHMRGNMKYDSLRFARHAFDAIAAGEPTTVEAAAEALGISVDQAQEHVEKFEAFGLMNLEDNTIVGALGLTTQETQYDVELNGRKLHVWCALDAVGIPAALGADARIKVDGLADIEVQAGQLSTAEPDSLRISLNDPYMEPNMKAQICPTISFHKEAGPDHEAVAWLNVEEAMELGRVIWAPPTPENTRQDDASS